MIHSAGLSFILMSKLLCVSISLTLVHCLSAYSTMSLSLLAFFSLSLYIYIYIYIYIYLTLYPLYICVFFCKTVSLRVSIYPSLLFLPSLSLYIYIYIYIYI